MSAALAAEMKRLNREVNRIVGGGGTRTTLASEVPLRIHTRDTDDGHGLGGPAFHPSFEAWMGQLCTCGREPEKDAQGRRIDPSDRGCPVGGLKFHGSANRMHPRRLQRALRQLRQIAPAEFDLVYLMAARGFSWQDAIERINTSRVAAGQTPHTEADFLILAISGFDKLLFGY